MPNSQARPTSTRWYDYILRVTEGLTAREVATRAGFDESAMTRWKKGLNADPKFVVQFARAFQQNVLKALAESELITDEEAGLHEVRVGAEDMSTQQLLEELARRIDYGHGRAPVASRPRSDKSNRDPDYSQMSDQDAYDLAAHKGEENIGHDEIPHEP